MKDLKELCGQFEYITLIAGFFCFIVLSISIIFIRFIKNKSETGVKGTFSINKMEDIKISELSLALLITLFLMAGPMYLKNAHGIDFCGKGNGGLKDVTKRNIEIEGKYYYRSAPPDSDKKPLYDEKGQPYYMLIGELDLIDKGNGIYSVHAYRKYKVSLIKERNEAILENTHLEWTADSNRVFESQSDKNQVIYSLQTKGNPPNTGFFIGNPINRDSVEKGKANEIDGEMFYLNRSNGDWTEAKKILKRVSNGGNPFIQADNIKEWFKTVLSLDVLVIDKVNPNNEKQLTQ